MKRVPGWVAREDRETVSLSGLATLSDGRVLSVRLTDISRDGCRVQSDETLGIGECVELSVGPLEAIPGKVRWSLFGTAGIRFNESIDL